MNTKIKMRWIAGFWRRIGAFIVDSIILGTIGLISGIFLENFYVEIGAWGRLFGFFIALFYFGILNSQIANGQTLGKRLLKIRVVDLNNLPISFPRSLVRYSIIGVPFFLNGAQLPDEIMFSSWIYLISIIIFGGLLSIIYLYIFNKTTRQSLHDLAVGSYVVCTTSETEEPGKIWKAHLYIVSLWFIAVGVIFYYFIHLAQTDFYIELMNTRNAIMSNSIVRYANIVDGYTKNLNNKDDTEEMTYISTTVFLKKK